jgi:hypothetical protein
MNDATMLELEALKVLAMQALVRPGQYQQNDCSLLRDIASRIRALDTSDRVASLAADFEGLRTRVAALGSRDQPIGPTHDCRRKLEESAATVKDGPGSVPADVHESGWQWRPTDDDSAYAPPFGTIRVCRVCGCLVAGGPTKCVRCVEAEKLDAVCARDAADIVRPPGHPLGQPTPERREIWVRYVNRYPQGVGGRDYIESHVADFGGEAVRMVEIRDGDVVLSSEQVKQVAGAVKTAAGIGVYVSSVTLRALGIEVES